MEILGDKNEARKARASFSCKISLLYRVHKVDNMEILGDKNEARKVNKNGDNSCLSTYIGAMDPWFCYL